MGNRLHLLLACIIFFFPLHGSAVPEILQPPFQVEKNETAQSACSYTVSIKTSCSSPRYTRDAISLFFGDFYHNQVYVPRLDDPASKAFERCSTDTFKLWGPCGGRTCYLYLSRGGYDGWTPESVKVFYVAGDSRFVVTFVYNVPIPAGVWYGFDFCRSGAADPLAVPGSVGTQLQ